MVLIESAHPDHVMHALAVMPPEKPEDSDWLKGLRRVFLGDLRGEPRLPEGIKWLASCGQVRAQGT